MRYVEWVKEIKQREAALLPVIARLEFQISARLLASVSRQVSRLADPDAHPDWPPFTLRLYWELPNLGREATDLGMFTRDEIAKTMELHAHMNAWAHDQGDLPDPATWNRPVSP